VRFTVSLTIDLPATATIETVEPLILDAGRQAMRDALRQAALAAQAHVQTCPACAHPRLHADGTARRVVLASFGRIEVPVLRKRCAACRHRFRASSAFFAPLQGANISPDLGYQAALAGADAPFTRAPQTLEQQAGAQLSDESLRLQTIRHGVRLALEHNQRAQLLLNPTATQIRAEREATLSTPLVPAHEPPDQLLVELDGGWLASRDNPRGMEGKVGVIATGYEAISAKRRCLAPRRYVATFGSAEELGALAYLAAEELGATESPRQEVLGDGAEWIKRQACLHFPEAMKVLDWAHLERAVQKAVRRMRPGRKLKSERWAAYEGILGGLWEGKVDVALEGLRGLRGGGGEEGHRALESAIGYIEGQREWLVEYGAVEAQGYAVGSGAVERAVEVVLNKRMKKQGMRWKRVTAAAVVALRVEVLNQAWDQAVSARKLAA
jgi:hypothetical protein